MEENNKNEDFKNNFNNASLEQQKELMEHMMKKGMEHSMKMFKVILPIILLVIVGITIVFLGIFKIIL